MPKFTSEDAFASVVKAATDLSNTDRDGTVVWDYVESDMYYDLNPTTDAERELISRTLDQFVNKYNSLEG